MHVKCPVWNEMQCNNRIRCMSIMMSLCRAKKVTLLFHAVESIKPRMKLEHRYSPWHDTDNAISSFRIKMLGCQHITSSFFPFIKAISWLINGYFQFHSKSDSMNMDSCLCNIDKNRQINRKGEILYEKTNDVVTKYTFCPHFSDFRRV